jgi:hypothetical protein
MSTTNGTHHGPSTTERDWNAWLAAADTLGFRDQRHACGNPDCPQLCESLFCSEACRKRTEGPDHEDAFDSEEPDTCSETPGDQKANLGVYEGKNGVSRFSLPEARASVNVRLAIRGHDCQVTLRDHDEGALLARLEALLQRYPIAQAPAAAPVHTGVDWCAIHQVTMKLNDKQGQQWYSHKTADGWCKGKGPRQS